MKKKGNHVLARDISVVAKHLHLPALLVLKCCWPYCFAFVLLFHEISRSTCLVVKHTPCDNHETALRPLPLIPCPIFLVVIP